LLKAEKILDVRNAFDDGSFLIIRVCASSILCRLRLIGSNIPSSTGVQESG
jgi:hypothetical protein